MMTCEQIRETLDTVNQSEMVTRHLNGCAPCRKEVAATAKLVSLLHAQPKVKAPADFMAQLQMRMATETVNEDARLKSLLQSVPTVSAPPDFAFRVRARLARAEQPSRNPLAAFGEWLAQSFSFGQAAGALAAVALVAALTTMQLRTGSTSEAPMNVAKFDVPASAKVVTTPDVTNSSQTAVSTPKVQRAAARESFAPAPAKATVAVAPTVEVAVATPASGTAVEPAMYSAKTRQEVHIGRDGNAYGQQLAKVMATKVETMTASAAF